MKETVQLYLERAQEYETKSEQTDNPALRIAYTELARGYRTLAEHAERGGLLGEGDAAD